MSDNFPYADCDRWITGNWGNDAFRDEEEPEMEEEQDEEEKETQ